MRVLARVALTLAALLLLGSLSLPATARAGGTDIREQLEHIPGLTVVDEAKAPQGYRFFHLTFTQPADHRDPSAGTFQQRLTLLHRDTSRPMVMYTSGYAVSEKPARAEPTALVDGNQLSMEYRYFAPSIPAKPDWTKQLTIWQAAADQHEIIKAFKKVYAKNWITTGGSKGGMTATFHRRFFPGDVSGTVPYVAPNDVIDSIDSYKPFLAKVGGRKYAQCRADLQRFQRESLQRRDELESLMRAEAEKKHETFGNIGSLDKAFETQVIDTYFGFWQYQDPKKECGAIPPKGAPAEAMYGFYDKVGSLLSYSDQELQSFVPYYYQAAYQLGSPEAYDDYLRDLLRYPGLDQPKNFLPKQVRPKRFDPFAMPDIDLWVRTQSQRMLYVYGGYDPWSAEPFDCGLGGAARDCHRYYVPGGNHGSSISQLPTAQRTKAESLVRAWAGVDTAARSAGHAPRIDPAFEVDELRAKRPGL
ncbi:S28 family serine protease [Sciscionella marina]|uniref:S28 family serine protease n=1 Tax=Sciscionella marina TaxID=508770 RepID=UPI0003A577C3|nr:S28 family serine protease [Sciscionella marina]